MKTRHDRGARPGRDTYRILTACSVLVVASIAAVISFEHISHLALTYGQPAVAAYLMPISVDGVVTTSSLAMIRSARSGMTAPRLARAGLLLGILATLAANVTSGLSHGPIGCAVAGWPAIGFVISAEIAISMVRRKPLSEMAWSKQDALYVVTGGTGIKVGVTHGDASARLRIHKGDGYPNCIRLFKNMPAGTAPAIENSVLEACESADYKPVKGREYFGLEALNVILDTVDSYVSQIGVENEADGINPITFSKKGSPRVKTANPRVTTPGLTRQAKRTEQERTALTALLAAPDMSYAELATQLGTSERTARRVKARIDNRLPAMNGSAAS